LPFYNALYTDSDEGYGAQCVYNLRNEGASSHTNVSVVGIDRPSTPSTRSSRSSTLLSTRDQKRLSLQTVQSRSFQKGDSPFGATTQQKGYKVFHPGVYEYSFEIALDATSPETIDLPLGSVKWILEALVERAGTFKSNLHGSKEVIVVRAPDTNSLDQVEPIAISRQWEDQLHYDIVISGKSFAIGSKIPIAFKLTPLAKVQCHRIKVFITENIEYFCKEKRVTRKDAQRKILLLEKQAGKPMSRDYDNSSVRIVAGGELTPDQRERARALAQRRREQQANRDHVPVEPLPVPTENLLGDLDLGLEHLIGQTEIEMEVQLPTCDAMRKVKSCYLAPDTTWKNIQVHHWIKVSTIVVWYMHILIFLADRAASFPSRYCGSQRYEASSL
jgi:arrestin-related trafficking adapter 3/6